MQPKTRVKFDDESFERIKRTIRNMSVGKRESGGDPSFATEIPDEVGIQLTNKCNLRCKHCFQWNDSGLHQSLGKDAQNEEINFDLIEKIMKETSCIKSNLYLWGGEPLSYGELPRLAMLLEKDSRWTVFCTNGIEVERSIDSLLRMSSSLAMLISMEGFEKENDEIRGKGTYRTILNNIKMLLDMKAKGIYKGEVSVNCVINEMMIGKLYDLAEMFEEIGINTLYLCFPWFISKKTSLRMDQYFEDNFGWLRKIDGSRVPSWHSYTHSLSVEHIALLNDDLKRITSREWNIRLRLQPALESEDLRDFLSGNEIPAQNRIKCIGIRNRMNVLPDGKITVCKLFPEFAIGDLNENGVREIWNNSNFQKARDIINGGLMPVCSKCILLYLHGV
jgi:radical SAM protein with 4Fe4S-binding SPASM domain